MSHIYDRLQVRSIINAYEAVSMIGGTHIRQEVLQAMIEAAERFVSISELQEKVGDRLAQLTRNEAAIVTNGAQAGLVLAVAACLAKSDARILYRLPDTDELQKTEVIVQRCQYTPYVVNIKQVGARIVDIGYGQKQTPASQLEAAISERTAAIFYSVGKPYERYAVPLGVVVEIAHARDIPVIVDAASFLPPAENLWHYTGLGADLVAFSGGKGIRGPQDSGFVVGRRDLLSMVSQISSPRHGIGRAMKSSKEDIVGLLVAVEAFLNENHDARYVQLKAQADRIARKLVQLPGVEVWVVPDGRQGQAYPRTVMKLLTESGWSRDKFMCALRQGDPSIEVGDLDEDSNAIYVNPISLSEKEEGIVVQRISELLSSKANLKTEA